MQRFVAGARSKKFVPDLGRWLVRLVLSAEPWSALCPLLVEEHKTRAAYWVLQRHKTLAQEMADPSPATHAILIQLKAGETADLLWTV